MSFARGVRFAPSPTGVFHLGNFRTAWISHELARALGEPWVVRFEDIDAPRSIPGAQEGQLADMAELGLRPDVVAVQSRQWQRHYELFAKAVAESVVYPCVCSRKDVQSALAGMASAPHRAEPVYNGKCRELAGTHPSSALPSIAWRFRGQDPSGQDDVIVARSVPGPIGREKAVVLPAKDIDAALHDTFAPAYHWACAIDDFDGNYKLLVRAWDLAPAAKHQRVIHDWVARVSGASRPPSTLFHASLVIQNDGARLEKRTPGVTLKDLQAAGWNTERLVGAFQKSFKLPSKLELLTVPDALLGEAAKEITVSEVLLTL